VTRDTTLQLAASELRPPALVRRLVGMHVGLALGGAVALSLPVPTRGWAVLVCVVLYAAALGLACRGTAWAHVVGFLSIVSVFQVVPDWILHDVLGTLRFPDLGGPRVDDTVPLAMALMWLAPLFLTLLVASSRPAAAAAAAFVIFAGAELLAPTLGLWEPTGDTARLLGVAVYVPPAEAVLGGAAAVGAAAARGRSLGVTVVLAALVSTTYTGALVVSYFLIDVASWRLTF